MASTDQVLALVRRALDEFEDRPLEASLRRAVRIATLISETQTAIRFSLELQTTGGSRVANGNDIKRLMADPAKWGDHSSDAEQAIAECFDDRTFRDVPDGQNLLAHSIGEMEWWSHQDETNNSPIGGEIFAQNVAEAATLIRVRQRVFVALCAWERQLTYSNTNERIFERFQGSVHQLLGDGAPELLDKFNAVYRRLREASESAPSGDASEELAHALTSCRRILKTVIDLVQPSQVEPSDGHVLDDQRYRNRAKEFTKRVIGSDTYREAVNVQVSSLYERFTALDDLASRGVHADTALAEAELMAITTFVVVGEILRLDADKAPLG